MTTPWPAAWREAEPLDAVGQWKQAALLPEAQHLVPGHHGGERDHDARQPEPGDEHAVERAHHERRCRPRRATATPQRHAGGGDQAGDDGAHAELRADRDVDLAGDDDQRDADRRDQRGHLRGEAREQRLGLEEVRREDGQRHQQQAERRGDGDLAEVFAVHATSFPDWPSAAAITWWASVSPGKYGGHRTVAHHARCGRSCRALRAGRWRS